MNNYLDQELTEEEIKEVEQDARTNPILRYPGVRVANVSKLSHKEIITISNKGLILIKGNLETGHEHIRARHNYWSIQTYPKTGGFQAQSKFPNDVPPMYYSRIADAIYSKENLLTENKHKDASKFEKYEGLYSFDNGQSMEKVNLVLYKSTKIIHSLYPQSNRYNKNRNRTKFPFAKGKITISISKLANNIKEIKIPYFDADLKIKYLIFIEKFYALNIEQWNLLVYDENSEYKFHVKLGEQKLQEFPAGNSEQIYYQHCDLTQFENKMMKIERGEIK